VGRARTWRRCGVTWGTVKVWVDDLQRRCHERWAAQQAVDIKSGEALLLKHHPNCRSCDFQCYEPNYQWRNPSIATVNSVVRKVYGPRCRGSSHNAPDKTLAWAICEDFRWRMWQGGDVPRSLRGPNADHWFDAESSVTPIVKGFRFNYYRLRDVVKAFALRVPRPTCDCGRRLKRGVAVPDVHTYLVLDAPFVKIGRTRCLKKRWGSGRVTDNPRELQVIATLCGDYESFLHSTFSNRRVNGEWFKDHSSIRKAFGLAIPQRRGVTYHCLPRAHREVQRPDRETPCRQGPRQTRQVCACLR